MLNRCQNRQNVLKQEDQHLLLVTSHTLKDYSQIVLPTVILQGALCADSAQEPIIYINFCINTSEETLKPPTGGCATAGGCRGLHLSAP